MPFRFVHAADIHLDSPLRSLALRNPDLADLIGNATRQAFVRVVDLCLDEGVDALLLAGDLYDDDQTSMKTARFIAEQFGRLHEGGVRTYVIRGNHDALSKITRELTFPDTVKIFAGRAEAVALERTPGGLDVVVHGLSFAQPHAPESLLPKYRPPVADAVNIGLMHTSLGGAEGHDPYSPCAAADLHASGFHYWALGHIHRRDVATGTGRAAIVVMPGMPQGRDIGEAGAKSVTLVTVADDRSVSIEERLTSVAQFERVVVEIDGIEDWRGALAVVETALGRARDAARSEHLVARLAVTGATPLAWRLRRDADLLREDVGMRAESLGRVWIDKIEIDVELPATAAEAAPGDIFAELQRLVDDDVVGSPDFRAALDGIAADLKKKLPPECRDAVLGAAAEEGMTLARLATEGIQDVLARLREPAGSEGG